MDTTRTTAWYEGSDRWTLLSILNHACGVAESTRDRSALVSLDVLATCLRSTARVVQIPRVRHATREEKSRVAWALGWLRREGFVASAGAGRMWVITPLGRLEVKRRIDAAVYAAMTRPIGITANDLGMSPEKFRKLCESMPRAK